MEIEKIYEDGVIGVGIKTDIGKQQSGLSTTGINELVVEIIY